ncbi:MAG: Gfo/Idh/MocA family protein [Saccharofermentanales bacterium]|jgi:scyllo-inositol 2-dehydrogenase (NADP+)|nr:Gfo/Idh/MocA family oxidoreductase [Clostridiaceae bacterium]
MKKRVAILGCGGMGSGHAIAIASGTGIAIWGDVSTKDKARTAMLKGPIDTDISKKLELAGVYDIDPVRNAWAAEQGYFVYADYDAILKDPAVDIVLIATPNHLHKDQAIAAMRAGKHVLCEKPVTPNSAELEAIMAVASETGKIFYPRQNRRWDPDFRIVKKIYDEQLVGQVFTVESRIQGSRGIPGDWRGIKEFGGGMMLDWGVHLLDRILFMVPEKVKKVFCDLTYITNDECDDGFKMHMTFESGLTASVEVGTCHFINLPLWYVAGKEGTAVINNWQCEGKIVRLKSWEDKDALPILAGAGLTKTMAPRDEDSTKEYELPEVVFDNNELYSNLVDTIDGTAEQIVTSEQALRVLKLMEAAFESSEKGIVVNFE